VTVSFQGQCFRVWFIFLSAKPWNNGRQFFDSVSAIAALLLSILSATLEWYWSQLLNWHYWCLSLIMHNNFCIQLEQQDSCCIQEKGFLILQMLLPEIYQDTPPCAAIQQSMGTRKWAFYSRYIPMWLHWYGCQKSMHNQWRFPRLTGTFCGFKTCEAEQVNEARQEMFARKRSVENIPPTRAALI